MLTDEKKAMMLARFDIFKRPVPRMDGIEKSFREVEAYWGVGVPLSQPQLRELWLKLNRERNKAVLGNRELGSVWRVVFTTIEEGLPPLIGVPHVLTHVVETFLKRDLPTKAESFVRGFINYFPAPQEAIPGVFEAMTRLADSLPSTRILAQIRLLQENGPMRAVRRLSAHETIQEGLDRLTGGLIAPQSRFAELAWKDRFARYRNIIAKGAFESDEALIEALRILSADSLDKNARLRDATELRSFTEAVLGDFLEYPNAVPSAFARQEIIRFFEAFLGARKDPNNASRWHSIADIVNPLFDFWEMGIILENIFEFAREAVDWESGAGSRSEEESIVATRHWTERRDFWLRYWRAGRFKNVRIYATTESRKREFSRHFRSKYPEVVRNLGMVYGHANSTFMFLFELRGDLVISEFSDKGALRIGPANSRVSPRLTRIYWEDIKTFPAESIPHVGSWKQKTDEAISILTTERVPR